VARGDAGGYLARVFAQRGDIFQRGRGAQTLKLAAKSAQRQALSTSAAVNSAASSRAAAKLSEGGSGEKIS